MKTEHANQLLVHAIHAAEQGQTLVALMELERLSMQLPAPALWSYLGYCLARERQQYRHGQGLCQQALQQDPANTLHYLNLGRIYLLAEQKAKAIQVFRHGLKLGGDRLILRELKTLGLRRAPVFPSLQRSHLFNRFAGKLRHHLSASH